MTKEVKILALAGSTRRESLNKKLAAAAAREAKAAGAKVTTVDLKDLDIPLYDGDLEAESGLPEGAKKLKQLLISHDGFIIASPEYNSSYTAVLKNAIDWASRPSGDDPPLAAFSGKFAAIMSASPGALGGLRGLVMLRMLLSNINVTVLPEQLTVPSATNAFDPEGNLQDETTTAKLSSVVGRLVKIATGMKEGA